MLPIQTGNKSSIQLGAAGHRKQKMRHQPKKQKTSVIQQFNVPKCVYEVDPRL